MILGPNCLMLTRHIASLADFTLRFKQDKYPMHLDEILAQPMLVVKPPAACSGQEIKMFCELVASAGEVALVGLRSRVTAAHVLAFLNLGQTTIGVTAIKHPNPTYRASVFAKAGVTGAERFPYELGWLIVDTAHRGAGYSEKLIRAALSKTSGGVFATSAAANAAVHRINEKVGLVPTGQPFPSSAGRDLVLFTRT